MASLKRALKALKGTLPFSHLAKVDERLTMLLRQ